MGTNNLYSVRINDPGIYYLHYEEYDYAGNVSIGYFGPFILADIIPPAHAKGVFTNQNITLAASGSTDNFTASNEIIYQVSSDNITFSDGNTIDVTTDGISILYFKVTDTNSFAYIRYFPKLFCISVELIRLMMTS